MNKADQKKLHAHPPYKAAVAAHAALVDALRRLDATAESAMGQYLENGGLLTRPLPSLERHVGTLDDHGMLERLRPRGDNCRVTFSRFSETYSEVEIENVTAARVLAGTHEFDLASGGKRGRGASGRIHPDDLAKIKAGELKGWRQKEWGK